MSNIWLEILQSPYNLLLPREIMPMKLRPDQVKEHFCMAYNRLVHVFVKYTKKDPWCIQGLSVFTNMITIIRHRAHLQGKVYKCSGVKITTDEWPHLYLLGFIIAWNGMLMLNDQICLTEDEMLAKQNQEAHISTDRPGSHLLMIFTCSLNHSQVPL